MTKQSPQWIPFYPAKWIAGTQILSADEEYVYFKLCMMAYEATTSFITSNKIILSRVCKKDETCVSNALAMLEQLGKIHAIRKDDEEGYYLQSVADVLDEVQGQMQARSDKASAAAKKRWSSKPIQINGNHANASPSNAKAMPNDAQYNTIHNNTVSKKVPPNPQGGEDDFNKFWDAYPKRAGTNPKAPARKKFLLLCKTTDPALIIEGAKKYAASAGDNIGTKHIAHATTFLNQERWLDDYTPPPPKKTNNLSESASDWD